MVAVVVLVLMSSPGLGTHPCSRLWARRSPDRRPGCRGQQTLPRDRASAGIPTRSSVDQRTCRPRRRAGHRSGVRPGPACPGRRTRSGTERVGSPARIATTPLPVTAPEVTACGNNARRHTTDRPTPCPEGARTLTCQNTSRTRLGKPPGAGGARARAPNRPRLKDDLKSTGATPSRRAGQWLRTQPVRTGGSLRVSSRVLWLSGAVEKGHVRHPERRVRARACAARAGRSTHR